MFGVHIIDYTMPNLGYQDFLLPKKLQENQNKTIIITSDRFTPIPNYENTWGKIMGPRITGCGDYWIDELLIKRIKPLFEIQRRILLKGLYSELKNLRPEYIFVHNILSMNIPVAMFYSQKYDIPLFIDSHLTFTSSRNSLLGKFYYYVVRKFYKINFKKISKFYGVAEECRDHMEQFLGIEKVNSSLLPIGIDEKIFKYNEIDRYKIREKFGVEKNQLLILQTGKLCKEKGVHLLPKILKNIDPKLLQIIKIVFVGAGDSEFLNEYLIKPFHEISFESFKIIGFIDYNNLPEYYSAADFILYPLASSLSALEAAACKCIVFMSDTEASKWRAEKGIGISIDFTNEKFAAETLQRYLSLQFCEIEGLKVKAANSVHKNFSYKNISESFLKDAKAEQNKII